MPISNILINLLITWGNCQLGYIGVGGLAEIPTRAHCTGGINKSIDQNVFGKNHIYGKPSCQIIYKTGDYDPEGLLGCLNSTF